jgi:hypothetical protein
MYGFMYEFVYGLYPAHRATHGATYGPKKTLNGQEFPGKRVFYKRKNAFFDVCVGKPTDFKSPPMVRQLVKELLRLCVLANQYFCIFYLRPKKKSIATNYMPEVVSVLSYDFEKMLESCPHELGWAS